MLCQILGGLVDWGNQNLVNFPRSPLQGHGPGPYTPTTLHLAEVTPKAVVQGHYFETHLESLSLGKLGKFREKNAQLTKHQEILQLKQQPKYILYIYIIHV